MAAYTSQASGNWSNPATWSPSGTPSYFDTATIQNTVTVDVNTTVGDWSAGAVGVTAAGILYVAPDITFTVRGGIANGGQIVEGAGSVIQYAIQPGGTPQPSGAPSNAIPHVLNVWQIIYSGFRIAGVLRNARRDFLHTGSYYADGLEILNDLVDEWATQRLTVPAELPYDFPLVPGQASYLIGPGGDWRVPRPSRIERANIVLVAQNAAQPLELPMFLMTIDGWRSIPQKTVASLFPLYLYYDMSFQSPGGCGQVSVFPVPQEADDVRLFLWSVLSRFSTVNDVLGLPPGYAKALKYNLAKEIVMRFPERAAPNPQMAQLVIQEAADSLAKLKSLNIPELDMPIDEALIKRPAGMWNWRTGNYQGSPF